MIDFNHVNSAPSLTSPTLADSMSYETASKPEFAEPAPKKRKLKMASVSIEYEKEVRLGRMSSN